MRFVQELAGWAGALARPAAARRRLPSVGTIAAFPAIFADDRHESPKFLYNDNTLDCRPGDGATGACLDPWAGNRKSHWRDAWARPSR